MAFPAHNIKGIYIAKMGRSRHVRRMMHRKKLAALAAVVLAITGCSPQGNEPQGNLTGAKIGGPFTLTDQNGEKRSWGDFKGKYRIVYFGYSYCPDVCPVDLQRIAQGFTEFEKKASARAAKVQPIFITLDPERDSPEVVKNYVSAFHPKMIGLTGSPEEIAAVAKAFVIVYMKDKPKGASEYLVNHSRTPYLFGPDGEPIALIPVDDPATQDVDEGAPTEVFKTLDRWVK